MADAEQAACHRGRPGGVLGTGQWWRYLGHECIVASKNYQNETFSFASSWITTLSCRKKA
jgi:hypothetical protein